MAIRRLSSARLSPPLVTPQLHRLIAQLPPVPTHTLPADPHNVDAYFSGLPDHVHTLLHKRRSTQSPSLIEQLTALPAFHNPAILQRILNTQHINQHETVWTEEREGYWEEDSVEVMKQQAEREQKERERRDEEERREQEAAAEQERLQRQRRDKQPGVAARVQPHHNSGHKHCRLARARVEEEARGGGTRSSPLIASYT